MMWCTKLMGLVVLLVSVLCNAGDLASEESSIRATAVQQHFETMIIKDDGVVSKLFQGCHTASRTMEIEIYSIDHYVRHVPDSFELIVPAVWQSVTMDPPVSSIMECAAAAARGMGKPMFKYNGGNDCRVSNRTYEYTYTPACETEVGEAVFLSIYVNSACPLPGIMHDIDPTTGVFTCITINRELMNYTNAETWCSERYSSALMFGETSNTTYAEIVQILNGIQGGEIDFFVSTAKNSTSSVWQWSLTGEPVNTTLIVGVEPSNAAPVMYMNGSDAFKFYFGPKQSFIAGVVCVAENLFPDGP